MAKKITKAARSKGKMAAPPPGMFKHDSPLVLEPQAGIVVAAQRELAKPAHKTPDRKTLEQREADAKKLADRKHRESVAEVAMKTRPSMRSPTDRRIDPGQLAKEIEGFLVGQHFDTNPDWPIISAALFRCRKNIQYGWTKFKEKCNE